MSPNPRALKAGILQQIERFRELYNVSCETFIVRNGEDTQDPSITVGLEAMVGGSAKTDSAEYSLHRYEYGNSWTMVAEASKVLVEQGIALKKDL